MSLKSYNSQNRLVLFFVFLLTITFQANGQRQSGRVYEFINLPTTARITSLGGYAVPGFDNDLGMALFYPSLIQPQISNQLSLNFVDYFADINYGTAAFSHHFNRVGSLTMAVQYIDYGSFIETDEYDNMYGDFSAGEYAISVGWGRALNERFSIGSNLKVITSRLEQYSSLGLAADIGFSYKNPEKMVNTSLVLRNIGRQITYYESQAESLPFDIVLGISKKLINAPLRLSLVTHNLHNYDLTYPELITPGFMPIEDAASTRRFSDISDKLLRHAVVGMEFLPTDNFMFGIGYNYRRRQEMKVDSRISTVGISWGIGVRISRFMFQYGRANYHLAGAPNHFSISTNLQELFQGNSSAQNIR